jgi:heptosyltransferase-1
MRVLIVRTGAMGDVLHALPAVAALRAAQPGAQIDWVIDERWLALLEGDGVAGPIVDAALRVDLRGWRQRPFAPQTLRSLFAFRGLRSRRYDHVVDMQGTLRSAAIGRLAGGGALAGYADPREPLAAALYGRRLARRGVHVVDQGVALLGEATGLALSAMPVALPHTEWADGWAAEVVAGRRVCVLAPSAGWAAKQWPVERFGELAVALRGRGFEVLVNAPRADDVLGQAVVAASLGAARVVVCNVAGLIGLVRRAALVVGGDSGPVHLAAALGVPVIALFGPTDPARNGPWGSGPVRVLRDPASRTSYRRSSEADPGLVRMRPVEVLAALDGII